jgi:hypothetical protein
MINNDKKIKMNIKNKKRIIERTSLMARSKAVALRLTRRSVDTTPNSGTHKYNENKLRKEQGLNERGAY